MSRFSDVEEFRVNVLNGLARACFENSEAHGFWDLPVSSEPALVISLKLCLIHSEISEALEAIRTGKAHDDKLVTRSALGVELADALIRILDLAAQQSIPIGEIVVEKMLYNAGRPKKHGKAF